MDKIILAKSNRGAPDPIGLHDATGTLINPATVEKLQELKVVLEDIFGAVDGLEIKADTINLNTDELETKIQSVRDQIDVLLSTRASEITLQSIKDSVDTVETKLQSLIDKNQAQENDGNLENIYTQLDITLSNLRNSITGLSPDEKNLYEVHNKLEEILVELSTKTEPLDNQNVDIKIDSVGIAKETTLVDVKTNTGNISTKIGEIQETPTQYSLLGRLKDLWDKLNSLFTTGLAKIKLWDGTEEVSVTTDNKLETITHGRGRCSALNSTGVALGAGGIFTGTWEEILDYSHVVILIKTDQNSAIDGLLIEWSCNGIDVDNDDKFNIAANVGKNFSFGAIGKYFRIKYTNGSTAQSYLRLQVLLKHFNIKPSSHRISDSIVMDDDAELVKAILTGKNSGEFLNVRVDGEGRLQVVIPPIVLNKAIQVIFDQEHSAVNAGEWQRVLQYIVPSGYDLNCISFDAASATANEKGRAIIEIYFGGFNCATNTFIDGTFTVLPQYASKLFLRVTAEIGSATEDIINITYINSLGVTGRTATVTISKSSLVGTYLRVNLQNGDFGVIDVTNITHSATGQAGTFNIEGVRDLFYLIITSSNVLYQSASVSLGGSIVFAEQAIILQYLAGTKTRYNRRINLMGTLVPK